MARLKGTTSPTRRLPEDPSVLAADVVVRALEVDERTGLSATEVAHRLERDGPNELRSAPPVPTWHGVRSRNSKTR